jgi:hypothetical protein
MIMFNNPSFYDGVLHFAFKCVLREKLYLMNFIPKEENLIDA